MAPRKSQGTKRAAVHSDPSDDEDDNASSQGEEGTDGDEAASRKKRKKGAAAKKKAVAANEKGKKGKGKGKKQAVASDNEDDDDDDEGDDDDEDAGTGKKGALGPDERNTLVGDLVRHVLFCELQKKPFKREDVIKTVLKNGRGRHFPTLLPLVQNVLKVNFGFELVQLRQKEGATSKNPPKVYIVRSALPIRLLRAIATEVDEAILAEEEEQDAPDNIVAWRKEEGVIRDAKKEEGAEYGLLGVILALVLVSGKVLGDDQLHSYLKRLHLYSDSIVPHSLALTPSRAGQTLTQFLAQMNRQHYLEKEKSKNIPAGNANAGKGAKGGDPSILWKWGARAEAEVGELGVAKFIQTLYEWKDPELEEEEQPSQKKRGNTGEKLIKEIARAADVPDLKDTDEVEVVPRA